MKVFSLFLRDVHSLHCPVHRVIHFLNIAINNDVKINHAKDVGPRDTFQPNLLRDPVLSLY